MKTENIKKYAPNARRDFIAAVTKQAARYGITAKDISPISIKGDVALIDDRPFPASIAKSREALIQNVEQVGFHRTMEQAAYSWFNRLCALRYMELADYLGHGRRVLCHPEQKGGYQILEDCLDIDLPGLDMNRVRELKLDGTRDEELYRELLLGQCHALHKAMPFLFEPVDDATELLLPENLTKTDSLIKELVSAIPEEDWANIEIIGWLYQFYISEKKDEVIGKVVKSEDIPAATQLFTPNWIVKYMVQNSLGAQWLATYPDSPLKGQMEYYIEPAEQTDEVKAQLAAITPSTLNPEELTLIDPASGSGHILVEAYELFKAIYLERGYRQRDVPQLILEKNLFGLDIDERAAQLTGFALMMKGRADDRRLFEKPIKLNVMALQDSTGFDAEGLAKAVKLVDYGLKAGDLTDLKRLFEHATTFGSLIKVPDELIQKLPVLKRLSEAVSPDLFVSEQLISLGPLVWQAKILAAQYDAVVANPPYMGSRFMNAELKAIAREYYRAPKGDLFAAALIRFNRLSKTTGSVGYMTPTTWLYLETYDSLRKQFLTEHAMESLVVPQYHTFFESAAVPICAFVMRGQCVRGYRADFFGLEQFRGSELQPVKFLEAITHPGRGWHHQIALEEFAALPGAVLAFELPPAFRAAFRESPLLSSVLDLRQGMATTDNDRFLRRWHEVVWSHVAMGYSSACTANEEGKDWFPYNKGGTFRKWFGNNEFVVLYRNNGQELLDLVRSKYPKVSDPEFVIKNRKYYLRPAITWSALTIASLSLRMNGPGFIFDTKGQSGFAETDEDLYATMSFLNSRVSSRAASAIAPTMDYNSGTIAKLPYRTIGGKKGSVLSRNAHRARSIAKNDWDIYQTSWDFQSLPILTAAIEPTPTLESSYTAWITQNRDIIAEMKRLEEENNLLFIDAYGLADELTPEVPIEQITLTVNPAYRYGGKLIEEERWTRFRQDTMEELVSYAIGCVMGRYSLDEPGLIYAHSGNEGFDPSRYTTFLADHDGIVPLTDMDWFEDDIAHRLVEFISAAWDKSHLEENLDFLADNLSPKRGESSRDTIRRYLCDSFFKHHQQTYKKRPIYWLFSSGKQKAFQCLVYLHRYNEGTLARMRTEYVIPLTSKLSSHVEKLEQDKAASGSTPEIKRLEKQIERLHKQQAELSTFDEKLRHFADQRISLDLDDGVKVNYSKFGDLLADVKAITGGTAE